MFVWNAQQKKLTKIDKSEDDISLEELQGFVSGYIEATNIKGVPCYVNEEALIDSSQFFAKTIFNDGTFILGNIIFLTDDEALCKLVLAGSVVQLKDTLN